MQCTVWCSTLNLMADSFNQCQAFNRQITQRHMAANLVLHLSFAVWGYHDLAGTCGRFGDAGLFGKVKIQSR